MLCYNKGDGNAVGGDELVGELKQRGDVALKRIRYNKGMKGCHGDGE